MFSGCSHILLLGCVGVLFAQSTRSLATRFLTHISTFAGTPALFLDPVSALHGDLGILSPNRTDVVILISYSGNTVELLHLAATLRTRCRTLVALTKCAQSPLSVASNIWLDASIGGDGLEADPGLPAPTSSLVVALGLLDALALAALRSNVGFEQEEEKQAQQSAASSQQAREVFVWNHPGGSLGLQVGLALHNFNRILCLTKTFAI